MTFIDYELLAKSIKFYETVGYRRIEAPWLVSEEIAAITMPKDVEPHRVIKGSKEKVFVGSGEQSFLSLINKGFLPPGRYQTVTPCMRDDNFGPFHTKYFIKNELIEFGCVNYEATLTKMLFEAKAFFKMISGNRHKVLVEGTEFGYDLMLNGVEIGSYGIRECSFTKWVYGTGLALPRFSRAILQRITTYEHR